VFVAATQKNITLFASAGDQGASQQTCDGGSWTLAASSPANDPLVSGVGGTELRAAGFCLPSRGCNPATHEAAGTYDSEIVWNEGPVGDFQTSFDATEATGGGFSVIFAEPPYQQSAIHGGKQRGVSDVAYNAAILHGVLTRLEIPGIPPGMYRFGGTSCGAPQWAAFASIVNQKAGKRLGFLNMGLYLIGSGSAPYAASFHDITTGNNSALEFDSSNNPVSVAGYSAGAGWDAPTGFGSPMAASLADYLIASVTSSDGNAAINTTKPKNHPQPIVPGRVKPH
jgi:subtilase family serine protease